MSNADTEASDGVVMSERLVAPNAAEPTLIDLVQELRRTVGLFELHPVYTELTRTIV